MRTTKDRLRHAIGFEVIGLVIIIPLATFLFNLKVHDTALLAIAISLIATCWNYSYNKIIDILMVKYLKRLEKTLLERIWHTIGFEIGLLIPTLPLIAWWLGNTIVEAFLIDIVMIVFYMVYAFIYNLIYDKVFPISMIPQETNKIQQV